MDVGNLTVKIGADTSGLKAGVAESEKTMDGFATGISGAIKFLAKFAAAATAAGAAIAVALVHNSLETIDAQYKLAKQLGGTTEGVQALDRAAQLAGVSSEELRKSMQTLDTRLGEAARTAEGPTSEALKRLGLSVKDLTKLDADERLAKLADRMVELGYSTQQQNDILRQLGIRSKEVFQIIADGGDSIREARKNIKDFGVAISEVDAKQIEIANDALTNINMAFKGIANQVAIQLAPIMTHVSELIGDYAKEHRGFGGIVEEAMIKAIRVYAWFVDGIKDTRLHWDRFVAEFLDGTNEVIAGLNRVSSFWSLGFAKPIEEIKHSYGKLKEKIGEVPTSEEWDKWFQEIKDKSRKAAEEAVAANENKKKNETDTARFLTDAQKKQFEQKLLALQAAVASEDEVLRLQREKQLKDLTELEKVRFITREQANAIRAKMEEKHGREMNDLIFNKLEQGVMTERDILNRKHNEQLDLLNKFENNRTLTAERAAELRRQIEEKHAIDVMQINAQAYSGLASIVDTAMGNISSIIGQEGGKQFGIMKAIAMATALVKGYEAAVSAYAAGSAIGGPPLGATFAAIAAAGTAALIAKLAGVNQNTQGAGSPRAALPSISAPALTQASSRQSNITISGVNPSSIFTGSQVRELIQRINEEVRDGAVLQVA